MPLAVYGGNVKHVPVRPSNRCPRLSIEVWAFEPAERIETGAARIEVTALGWDTEGTGRERTNLLRPQTIVDGAGSRKR